MAPAQCTLTARHRVQAAVWAIAMLVGNASADEEGHSVDSLRHRKSLLSWNFVSQSGEEGGEEVDDRLVTDRPHFSEASSLVGLGRIQLETGYTYFRDANAGTVVQTHSFPEPLLRAGIFAEWFEFRLGYNYLIERTVQPTAATSRFGGSDDLYLGAKIALAEQAGCLPEVALFPQMRLPTGHPFFTNGEVLPGFNLAYSWKLNRLLELECNTQLNRRIDELQESYTEFIQTANMEYDLAQRLGAFTELIAFVPSSSQVAQNQYYFHAGFVFLPTPNMQFDVHAGVGLNRAADNLAFTGVGWSKRW